MNPAHRSDNNVDLCIADIDRIDTHARSRAHAWDLWCCKTWGRASFLVYWGGKTKVRERFDVKNVASLKTKASRHQSKDNWPGLWFHHCWKITTSCSWARGSVAIVVCSECNPTTFLSGFHRWTYRSCSNAFYTMQDDEDTAFKNKPLRLTNPDIHVFTSHRCPLMHHALLTYITISNQIP